MFNTVLVPLDLGEPTHTLQALFSTLTKLNVATVRVVHVAGSRSAARSAAERLDAICGRYNTEGFSVTPEIRVGSPVLEILQSAHACSAQLIALPWKRLSWIQRSLTGSVSRDLARQTDLPLLVFREGRQKKTDLRDGERFRVTWATDLDKGVDALRTVIEEETIPLRSLTIVYAGERAPDPAAEQKRMTEAQEHLDRLAEHVQKNGTAVHPVEIDAEALVGPPRRVLPRFVNRTASDVILIGKGGGDHGVAGIMGSIAEEIAHRAHGSVLVFPTGEDTQ